jgi:voltage-gated potassium channel
MSTNETNQTTSGQELKNTGYELFILLVSCLSIFNLVIIILPGIDPILKGVVHILDLFLSMIFIADFLYRLFTAESRFGYFFKNWGWADLLASLPFQQVKIFRIFRIIRVFRLLRSFGIKNMLYDLRDNRAGSALYIAVFMVILVLEFAGTAIIAIEGNLPDANIKTASDAIWWGFVTITTVGYGDRYPVSNSGRFVGMLVMMLGVGLFGVLTGFLANAFLAEDEPIQEKQVTIEPQTQLSQFRQLLEEQEKMNIALRAQLTEIEKLIGQQTIQQ